MTRLPAVGRAVIPFADLTPAACEYVADTVEQAMGVFAAWDIPLPRQQGLREAVVMLREVASAGAWGTIPADLARLTPALTLAGDFILIAQCLGNDPVVAISNEMRPALGEGLATIAKVGGYDIHSQYWFGMLLARAGLRPRVPRAGERRPDFVVAADGIDFGVEHKRPQSERSAPRALDAAAGQLRDYGSRHHTPGVIVMDLSAAIGTHHLAGARVASADGELRTLIGRDLQGQAGHLDRRVSTYTRSDKYERIVGLICYVRTILWIEQRSGLVPTVTAWVTTDVMEGGCHGLIQDTVQRLFHALKGTIQEFGDSPLLQMSAL